MSAYLFQTSDPESLHAPINGRDLTTPLIEVTRLDTGPCQLFVKLDSCQPGGSVKDRIARALLDGAESRSQLRPGGIVVEASSGNTGAALAVEARCRGYDCRIVIPAKTSVEKEARLKALGAEVIRAPASTGHQNPEYYINLARNLATALGPKAFFVDQYANPDNPRAHETGTAPEIWGQMGGKIDAVVLGAGSGGTFTGVGRYLRRTKCEAHMILADPEGSVIGAAVDGKREACGKPWIAEGVGKDYVPANLDLSLIDGVERISDVECVAVGRAVLLAEGLFVGPSSALMLAAALRYCRQQTEALRVFTLVADGGSLYLSSFHNPEWLAQRGL